MSDEQKCREDNLCARIIDDNRVQCIAGNNGCIAYKEFGKMSVKVKNFTWCPSLSCAKCSAHRSQLGKPTGRRGVDGG